MNKVLKKKNKDLFHFRMEIDEYLTAVQSPPACKDFEEDEEPPQKKNSLTSISRDDLRLDEYHHWSRVIDLKATLSYRHKVCAPDQKSCIQSVRNVNVY